MKISSWEFEKEMDALIYTAKSAGNTETARRFLIQAENKIYGYDNIPYDVQQRYMSRIEEAKRELNM